MVCGWNKTHSLAACVWAQHVFSFGHRRFSLDMCTFVRGVAFVGESALVDVLGAALGMLK